MKILESNVVQKKIKKKKIPADMKYKIIKKIQELHQTAQDKQKTDAYLNKNNGKKLKGNKEGHIFKFRLNDGDRILYTYGKYLSGIRKEDEDSLVILDCVTHDKQGRFRTLPVSGKYEDIFQDINDEVPATEEDLQKLENDEINEEDYLKSFTDMHALYIYNEQMEMQGKYEDFDVYLSEQQNEWLSEYIERPKPTIILGGAGSGKTVMALHVLHDFILNKSNVKCAYFTQSEELLRQAKAKYKVIASGDRGEKADAKEILFCNINEYCLEKLGLKEKSLVRYDCFKEEFVEKSQPLSKKIEKEKIRIYDLWAEIRGTIKGGLSKEWSRSDWFDQRDERWNVAMIKELEDKHFMIRSEKDPRKFRLKPNVLSNHSIFKQLLSADTFAAYNKMIQISKNVNPAMRMMEEEEYNTVSEENTTLEKEKRKFLYQFCKKDYQVWLDRMGYYDENDLVCKMLEKEIDTLEKFDLIVIDEIQDYTELQIYLIYKMINKGDYMFMVGDPHQIVNPTMFRERRLFELFGKENMQIHHLTKNFRCQKEIVDYANALAYLRKTYIGSTKGEEDENSIHTGQIPFHLSYSKENMMRLIGKLLDYPNAVILVPDESVKINLITLYGKEAYEKKGNHVIFTVPEIKGMEYRSVFCYNLIGYYYDIWSEILCKDAAKKKTKYRQYFNLLYVGVSRAQEYLCFIEERRNKDFDNAIEKKLCYKIPVVSEFDEKDLYLSELENTQEDWMIQAEKYMKQGKYKDAINCLKKAEAAEEKIMECKMYLCVQERKFQEMMMYALCLNCREMAEKYYRELEKKTTLFQLITLWLNPAAVLSKKQMEKDMVIKWIDQCFPKLDQSWKEEIMVLYIKLLSEYMLEQIKSI